MENKLTPKQVLEELQVEWEFNNKELPRGFVDTRYEIIEQALTEHEKQKKLLKVLKNKKVNIIDLTCDIELSCCDNEALRFYNQNQTVENKLTLTEFNLIKEWLK